MRAEIDLADLQGDVLRGYTYPSVSYLFLKIVDPERMRDLMRRMLAQVSTAEPWESGPPPTALHAAFTYDGLVALELPDDLLATFPDEFREGMAARAEQLGDRGPSAPANWETGLGTGEAHVLVTLYGVDEERLEQAREALRGVGAAGAIKIVHEQRAAALDEGRDHFGFADGIAQPAIKGSGVAPRPGDGLPDGRGGWRPVRTGEFLHGYEDEDGAAARGARRALRPQRHLRRLPQAPHGRRRVPPLRGRERLPRRPRAAGRQARRPPPRRHAARAPPGDQRLHVRRRPRRPGLPARRPHPPRQPARLSRASSTAGSPAATASSAAAAPTAPRSRPAPPRTTASTAA